MAVLLGTKHVAGTPDFQVAHGNLEARAKLRKLPDGGKPLGGVLAERLVGKTALDAVCQKALRSADPSLHKCIAVKFLKLHGCLLLFIHRGQTGILRRPDHQIHTLDCRTGCALAQIVQPCA